MGNQIARELPASFEDMPDKKKEGFLKMRKLKESGKNVVGTFCTYTPKEVMYAAEIVPVGLCGVDNLHVADAEVDLPANLCPLIKSSYGNALTDSCPYFYFSDMILGETTCDGKKKMYEILNKEIKETYIMMLPQSYDLESGVRYYMSEIERFIKKLESRFNVEITEEKLRKAIHESNEDRKHFAKLLKMGELIPAPFKGLDMINILQNYDFCFTRNEKNEMVDRAIETAESVYERIRYDEEMRRRPRILLTGGPNAGLRQKVVKVFDDNNADIVVTDSCNGIKEKLDMIDETLPPIEALAKKYIQVPCSVMTQNDRRIESLGKLIDDYHIDGVFEVNLQACHTFQIESRRIEKYVTEVKKLPYSKISTDYSNDDKGQINTRINAFLEML